MYANDSQIASVSRLLSLLPLLDAKQSIDVFKANVKELNEIYSEINKNLDIKTSYDMSSMLYLISSLIINGNNKSPKEYIDHAKRCIDGLKVSDLKPYESSIYQGGFWALEISTRILSCETLKDEDIDDCIQVIISVLNEFLSKIKMISDIELNITKNSIAKELSQIMIKLLESYEFDEAMKIFSNHAQKIIYLMIRIDKNFKEDLVNV